ncbi:universal stress protein [Paenarthrobacter sp. S56]|uniref:universal stress protein n=1 Tax=Paenarthrobacter sp. S56 TaxID=3138179 RepID=UPI00321BCDCF
MTNSHILAALDGSPGSALVADWAAARAEALHAGLALVHVTPASWAFRTPEDLVLANKRAADLLTSESERIGRAHPGLDVSCKVLSGEPAETLAALSPSAALLVAGTDRGPGTEGQGYGSVSFQIAVTSQCPVAIIPRRTAGQPSGVVAGVDGSPDSIRALELAAGEAHRLGEELVIVHATGPVHGGQQQDEVVADAVDWVRSQFPDVEVRVRLDPVHHAAEALAAASHGARLLVIGRKGRGGLRVLLGSVAQHTLLNVQCPTMLALPATIPAGATLSGLAANDGG